MLGRSPVNHSRANMCTGNVIVYEGLELSVHAAPHTTACLAHSILQPLNAIVYMYFVTCALQWDSVVASVCHTVTYYTPSHRAALHMLDRLPAAVSVGMGQGMYRGRVLRRAIALALLRQLVASRGAWVSGRNAVPYPMRLCSCTCLGDGVSVRAGIYTCC